ncbi:hypothetical protein JTB14_038101 [Gonioctena quinquepunctata]|nr:hypothetical protein JTB14_038101 [Gonioctena quinquepunctata]
MFTRRLKKERARARGEATEAITDNHPLRNEIDLPILTETDYDTKPLFMTNRPVPNVEPGSEEEVAWRRALAASAVRTYFKQRDKLRDR